MSPWTIDDARGLYNVDDWGKGYFGINAEGHVVVQPDRDGSREQQIDIVGLIDQIKRRGVEPPLLLRFDGILRSRVREMFDAFNRARLEYDYPAPYACVFPIKVNQQRHLVDELLAEGAPLGMGIEVGSKPELLAVMGSYASKDRLIICNGYKDRAYIEIVLLCQKLGATPIIVIEKFSELATIQSVADEFGIRPLLGVRTKLMSGGAGRWKESAGERSKFGLSTREIVRLVEALEADGMLDCLQLLHFHLGSQITNIRAIKGALAEASRTLIALHEMGATLRWMDVGGGLGIDYDGSSSDLESSVNYSLQEYANDVVYHLKSACDNAGIPHPTILSESGRALTAHHAVLITEALGVSRFGASEGGISPEAKGQKSDLLAEMEEVCAEIDADNFQESYHDVQELRERMLTLYRMGQASLRERAAVEELYWQACEEILSITRTLEYVPDGLEHLERSMADTYFLNFSIFQSMPDSWAIGQLFPVLPLHRLQEEPKRRGVLVDITCDSDGRVDRFIDLRETKHTLELHSLKADEPYYLGFFLVGAYQEILGDMHNLFGDTHVIHVDAGKPGHPRLSHYVAGDRVEEVLSYVEYFAADLKSNLRAQVEQAIEEERLSIEEGAHLQRRFESGLASYTYLQAPKREEKPYIITPRRMKISKDTSVTINYKLFDAEGQEVESTFGDEPITYTHGYEEILVGLEKALEGQEAGATLTVKLESDDAYGPHNPEGIFAVPLSELPPENDYKKGDWISVHVEEDGAEEGHEHGEHCDHEHGDMEVMIHEIRGDEVILDANHPLAGQPISFEVEVLKVEGE